MVFPGHANDMFISSLYWMFPQSCIEIWSLVHEKIMLSREMKLTLYTMHNKSGALTLFEWSDMDLKMICTSPLSFESFHKVSLKSGHLLLNNSMEKKFRQPDGQHQNNIPIWFLCCLHRPSVCLSQILSGQLLNRNYLCNFIQTLENQYQVFDTLSAFPVQWFFQRYGPLMILFLAHQSTTCSRWAIVITHRPASIHPSVSLSVHTYEKNIST